MIINVGLRTDIVTYYSDWLFRRFREGVVESRNPLFPNRVTQYTLTPKTVDAVLFCSKNYAPALARLSEITGKYRTLFHFTLNGYGTDVEPKTPPLSERLQTLSELARIVGKERVYWRYDPVLLTKAYTAEWHAEQFRREAEAISPYVAGVIVGFVEMFIRLQERLPSLIPLDAEKKTDLLRSFGETARKLSLPIRTCKIHAVPSSDVPAQGCVTLDDIGRANGCRFKQTTHEGNKRGCACIQSRDIGWYDCCPAGCLYCNANRTPENVSFNAALHDPASPLLIGSRSKTDVLLKNSNQTFSILDQNPGQISLFD